MLVNPHLLWAELRGTIIYLCVCVKNIVTLIELPAGFESYWNQNKRKKAFSKPFWLQSYDNFTDTL